MKKNGREITKLALSVSFFFHSSGVLVSSNQICIYYDSSRFCSPLAFLLLLCYEWKRDIISNSGDVDCDKTQGHWEPHLRQYLSIICFLLSSSCTDKIHRIIQTISWSHVFVVSSLRTEYLSLWVCTQPYSLKCRCLAETVKGHSWRTYRKTCYTSEYNNEVSDKTG